MEIQKKIEFKCYYIFLLEGFKGEVMGEQDIMFKCGHTTKLSGMSLWKNLEGKGGILLELFDPLDPGVVVQFPFCHGILVLQSRLSDLFDDLPGLIKPDSVWDDASGFHFLPLLRMTLHFSKGGPFVGILSLGLIGRRKSGTGTSTRGFHGNGGGDDSRSGSGNGSQERGTRTRTKNNL